MNLFQGDPCLRRGDGESVTNSKPFEILKNTSRFPAFPAILFHRFDSQKPVEPYGTY